VLPFNDYLIFSNAKDVNLKGALLIEKITNKNWITRF